MKMYDKLLELRHSKSVCLIAHIDPDTDALSSMVVLKEFLKNKFSIKSIDIFAECKSIPNIYTEILGFETINKQPKTYDTAIMMDAPNVQRLGIYKDLFLSAKKKIVIDHHATNEFWGDINIVEFCSSTAEIIFSILKHYKYNLTREIKGKLYAGIITDTNNFTVGNFNKRTFKITAECVDQINKTAIYNHFLANNSLKQMNLLSIAIQNLKTFNNGKILVSHISKNETLSNKANEEDFSGIINKLATISGNYLVCFIYPKNGTYYVSMRAKEGFDVATIAKKNGGGGHKGASAYLSNFDIPQIEKKILTEFKEQIKLFKPKSTKIF